VTTHPAHSTRLRIIWRGVVYAAMLLAVVSAGGVSLRAQTANGDGRFLAKEDILLFGLGLHVECNDGELPDEDGITACQTVPKGYSTAVPTMFVAPQVPDALPGFGPDAVIRATLRGPSFPTPIELTTRPNTPFTIPPMSVPGLHSLDDIRLVVNGQVLLHGDRESAMLRVIDKLLVTQVTAHALTAEEERAKGLVFDKSNFQAYNFAAAFAINDQTVPINFTVVLPKLQSADDANPSQVRLPSIGSLPGLPSLQTVIPDSLKSLSLQVPNLSVAGFSLKIPETVSQNFYVPPIPGVVVIPGDIGFLNQFFSVMLMVGNVAPAGSGLVVSDLSAEIVLPPGDDTVVDSPDDPLAMGKTDKGETPRTQPVTQPGSDGVLGTADDIHTVGPGETGNAEFLVEGRREGTHLVEMRISGTLHGLPIGPVPVTGIARGAVLVRNPSFTLTFTHPEVVSAGEEYSLDVTITNTSASPANFVSLNLYPRFVTGATILGEASREVDSILPGDSATVSFNLRAEVSGKVTAATFDADGQVAGRFILKTAVGELGIPLSPDSLVLPKEARELAPDLRAAAVGLLGKAWSVATAPASALPADVQRFSKKIVIDRAIEVAEAGFRRSLHESEGDNAAQLLMDFAGSNLARLPGRTAPADLASATADYVGFDDLRRRSVRGDTLAAAVATLLQPGLMALGASQFHEGFARSTAYRPPSMSVLVTSTAGALPVMLTLRDSTGRTLGGTNAQGKVIKEIPFSDYLSFNDETGITTGQMAIVAVPASGNITVQLEQLAGAPTGVGYTLSLVIPDSAGHLRQFVFSNVGMQDVPAVPVDDADPYRVTTVVTSAGVPLEGPSLAPVVTAVPDLPPSIVGIVQQAQADQVCVDPGKTVGMWRPGRIIAVLFSEEVTPQSVQDKLDLSAITNYALEDNQVVGVALQPGGRIAMIALRDPIGPFIPRGLTISNVEDLRGQSMSAQTQAIEPTVTDPGGVVSGRIIQADGTPVPFASLRLFYPCEGGDGEVHWIGISQKSADANGQYQWDYVLGSARVLAVDPETDDSRDAQFRLARNGQRLNVDLVMLGRGTIEGRTLAEDGHPLADSSIRITSLTDQSQYAARTDADGHFAVSRIPVGNVFIEAVNTDAQAQFSVSDLIPFAGATITSDLVLLRADSPKQLTVKKGTIGGHVLRTDEGPTAGLPVIVFYQDGSQPGVRCPKPGDECAIATGTTDADGHYLFANVPAGGLHVRSFDQETFQQGDATTVLTADSTATVNVILAGGLGTVKGRVLDPDGNGVAAARVGGGYSLTVTDSTGHFTLNDVPLGERTITAVSDALQSTGTAVVDLVRAGEEVPLTIVLNSYGTVAGVLSRFDGTPAPNVPIYLFRIDKQNVIVVGQAVSNEAGQYTIESVPLGDYTLSAFTGDFSDGNLVPVAVTHNHQVVKADVRFRGGNGGKVTGTIVDADGQTPLKGRVSISSPQPVIAGGRVVVRFDYVQNYQIVDTGLNGVFTLGGIWPGDLTIRAAGVFSPDPISFAATMPAPPTTLPVTIRLEATSSIGGTVYQPDGVTPVGEGVLIKYKSDGVQTFCSETSLGETECVSIPKGIQELNAVTQTDGTFLLPIVTAGPFTLTITDNQTGRSTRVRGTVRAGERAALTPRLLGRADVQVHVFTSDLKPVPGARVTIQPLDDPDRQIPTHDADPSGIARFSGGDALAEGMFVVKAEDLTGAAAAGRASGRVVADGETVRVDVFLYTQVGTVSGTVYRADGTPAPNAQVIISTADGPLTFSLTDHAGAYQLDQIPVNTPFSVEVFDPVTAARGAGAGTIFLAGQDVPVNIHEDALAVVTGTLVDGSTRAPLKGWQVSLTQTSPSGATHSLVTTTGLDGGFAFPGASVGPFHLAASKANVLGGAQTTGTVDRPGQAVNIILVATLTRPAHGRLTGVVVNPDGSPAGNTQVDVCIGDCAVPYATVATDAATGEFALDNVPLTRLMAVGRTQDGLQSGSSIGQITFDGETIRLVVVLAGISKVTGTVSFADGRPARNANVVIKIGNTERSQSANDDGEFTFTNVSARFFTVVATDPVTLLKGSFSDLLNPGESREAPVVLQPTGSVVATVQGESGTPAFGVAGEIVIGTRHFFAQSGANGTITFEALPVGQFTLTLEDPLGIGVAARVGTVAGPVDLGTVTLDSSRPVVTSVTPESGSIGVPSDTRVRIVFSEPLSAASVNAAAVLVSDGTGLVEGTVTLSDGDTTATFTPTAVFKEKTQYSVRITGVRDLSGHEMAADHVTSFTTKDVTKPTVLQYDPAPGTTGANIFAPIRIVFSEPIDVARFRGPPPLTVTAPDGPVAGRLDFVLGGSAAVFTPNIPLLDNTVYHVTAPAAVDLAGNEQAQATAFDFRTTDRTPPTVTALTAAGDGRVIENTVTIVQATVGTTHDVAFVDFYLNGVFKAKSQAPYVFSFQAVAALGLPGSGIVVTAVATDTSGVRGPVSLPTTVMVLPDTAPTISVTPPVGGSRAPNGGRIEFVVATADDVGLQKVSFHAATGDPRDTAEHGLLPPDPGGPLVRQHSETFGFNVPSTALPGSTIQALFTVVDTKAQATTATYDVEVLDAIAPSVTVTGASSGTKVSPGQTTTIVVSASDLGGLAAVTLKAGGVAALTQTRTIDPAQNSIVTTFSVTVPSSAQPPQSLTIDVSAVDRAGNVGTAPRAILPVADGNAPAITSLRTSTGALTAVAGTTVAVLVDATDDIGVSRVDLVGAGAFAFADGKQIQPPLASGSASFTIPIPATITPGSVLTLTATATDLAGNVGLPATLALTITSSATVTLPPSVLLDAGESQVVTVQISVPAPPGGTTVTFTSNPTVATITSPVTIPEGETTTTASITGIATGTTTIDARIAGVVRGSMTATVTGGIVKGTVRDTQLAPVANATVVVSDFGHVETTETDASGQFEARGLAGPTVSIKAFKDIDSTTRLLGFSTTQMNRANGIGFADLVLISAGVIRGTALSANGVTPAGVGVQVDLYESTHTQNPITTTFTDEQGRFEFPLVAMGDYIVITSQASTGARGRATTTLSTSGQEVELPITFLGSGTVTITVKDGAGNTVKGANVALQGFTVFGQVPLITRTSNDSGQATFTGVSVGTFRVDANDPVTGRGASVAGELTSDQQVVEREVTLASYGTVAGTVFRADGMTTVSGATVTLGNLSTVTDTAGHYEFAFVPLGGFSITVRDDAVLGQGSATGTLTQHGSTLTVNVTLLPQGALVITVRDANDHLVPGASVGVGASLGSAQASFSGTTGDSGTVVFDHVLAGTFTVLARYGGLAGTAAGTLIADDQNAVTVTLQPTASITGLVRAPNLAPVTEGSVWITNRNQSVPIQPDGTYRFEGLPLGSYSLQVRDSSNRVRARSVVDVQLTIPNQEGVADFTFVGLGTVTGRVVNPDGSSAQGVTVQVRALNPLFGSFANATTNAGGIYTVENLAVGPVTVSASNTTLKLRAEGDGTLLSHAQTLTIDLLLQNNLIDVPVDKWDANGFRFDIQKDGSIRNGRTTVFAGSNSSGTWGASLLDIVANGTTTRFTGDDFGTVEDGAREVAVRQDGVAGLSVTRKVFVPASGYFARYLESLTNPTEQPIAVDVLVTSHLRQTVGSGTGTTIIATSSGDATLDVSNAESADRWITADDANDEDPFLTQFLPATAFVFDGADAAQRVGQATFGPVDPQSGFSPRRLTYGWNAITIQPGQTVSFLHFTVQQVGRAGAQASAERLSQLPPEALAGLNGGEIADVQNFAIPENGSSPVPPLPALTGQVSGRVLAWDATTTVSSSTVRFHSTNPLFGRTLQVNSNATGVFSLAADDLGLSSSLPVPVEPFTLVAVHPQLSVVTSPATPGQFADGSIGTQQDVVFSNTGMARGVVSLNGVPVNGVTVHAEGKVGATNFNLSQTTGADGSYTYPVLPAVPTTFSSTVSLPTGGTRSLSTAATIAAGALAATPLAIDTLAPAVAITSPTSTTAIDPRSALPVTVILTDQGGATEVTLQATGVTTFSETRPIVPPLTAGTQTFSVPFATLPVSGGTLTLTALARDGQNNQASASPVSVNILDVVAPQLMATTPSAGATGIEPTLTLAVNFSEAVSRATVTTSSVSLLDGGTVIPVTLGFGDGDRLVTVTPVQALPLNRTFNLAVTTAVTDVAGNALAAPLNVVFKTKSPDTIPPSVVTIVPASGAVNVPVSTAVAVTFSEPIERSSITTASFNVAINNVPVGGHFVFGHDDAEVQFVPDVALPFDAVGVVQLSAAITDRFENPLAGAPLTFTFATGTFGITRPTHGTDVLENTVLTLEASATSALDIASVVFTVNGQALPAAPAPTFSTTFTVGTAAAMPTLTIVASGRTAAGIEVATDQIVVPVVAALRASPRLFGVPVGGTAPLRLILPAPLATDLTVQLASGDATTASLVAASVVIPAGQTEATIQVSGVAVGATTITATSSRGVAWAIASVSEPVAKQVSVNAAPVLMAALPIRSAGRIAAPANGVQPLVLPLLAVPAGLDTPVTITTSNSGVASVDGVVLIPQGSRTADIPVTTGAPGMATLRIEAGGTVMEVTVVVGQFPPDLFPPVSARPVGLNVLPVQTLIGRVIRPEGTQASFTVPLLSAPADSPTVVTVSSSDPAIAQVLGSVIVPAGSQSAPIQLQTGAAGTVTLTFTANGQSRSLTVIVGTPPPDLLSPVTARPVGVNLLPPLSAGRVITPTAGQTTVTVQLLSSPAAQSIPVAVTSSDPNVATVSGPLTIAAGALGTSITLQTGAPGTATLTFIAGGEARELRVIVGTPPPDSMSPVMARPVGVVVLSSSVSVFGPIGGMSSVDVPLLGAPAATAIPVIVTSSDSNVAYVPETPAIAAGATSATLEIVTGAQGVASLTIEAGGVRRQLEVVVGTPPPDKVPTVVAPVVGVDVH
jgi:5-hydroxyisourate hydrolase-like protein (transthyretin family)